MLRFLCEEESMEVFIRGIASGLGLKLSSDQVIRFQGKYDLLKKLPDRLVGFRKFAMNEDRFIILIDNDSSDCGETKSQLEAIALNAGFSTKASSPSGQYQVVTRVVIQELEAWLLGDEKAVRKAFPSLGPSAGKAKFKNPERLRKPSHELERMLDGIGNRDGKIERAKKIAKHFSLDQNACLSFHRFVEAVKACS